MLTETGTRPLTKLVAEQEFVRAFVQPALNITRDFLSREVNIDARSHPQLIQIVYSCLDLAFQHRLERASTVMVEDEKPYKFRYITKLTGSFVVHFSHHSICEILTNVGAGTQDVSARALRSLSSHKVRSCRSMPRLLLSQ